MQYRVQFLDRSDNVIRELRADPRSPGFPLLTERPPHAAHMRVIYPSGYVSTVRLTAYVAPNIQTCCGLAICRADNLRYCKGKWSE